jgi:hypothetical protein
VLQLPLAGRDFAVNRAAGQDKKKQVQEYLAHGAQRRTKCTVVPASVLSPQAQCAEHDRDENHDRQELANETAGRNPPSISAKPRSVHDVAAGQPMRPGIAVALEPHARSNNSN